MIEISVLCFEGCPNGPPTLDLVKKVATTIASDIALRSVDVPNDEVAQTLKFLGSPSVHVEGLDIEVNRRNDLNYGMACRVYGSGNERVGIPPESMLRSAIEEAQVNRS